MGFVKLILDARRGGKLRRNAQEIRKDYERFEELSRRFRIVARSISISPNPDDNDAEFLSTFAQYGVYHIPALLKYIEHLENCLDIDEPDDSETT